MRQMGHTPAIGGAQEPGAPWSANGWNPPVQSRIGLSETAAEPGVHSGADRRRVEAVVETLALLRGESETLAQVAHDARNMVTALGLYCDLLEEPGVLGTSFAHYAGELRLVATASRRLVEKLVALDARKSPDSARFIADVPSLAPTAGTAADRPKGSRRWDLAPAAPISNLAEELLANRNLLAALAGPSIALTVEIEGGSLPVRLNGEDLTRILVNLVKNAAEAMPEGGRIQIGLRELTVTSDAAPWLSMTVDDNGPGIPRKLLDKVFESGFTTRSTGSAVNGGWPATHRGLGLAITRSIVEAAGGQIRASNRPQIGTRLEIDLPVGSR